jgi:colanic acid biosynthesis glycosyl transferase WcaI
MKVYHAWMPRKGKHVLYRILTWFGFHVVSTIGGILEGPRPDLVLTPSPPLTIGVSAWLIARIRGAKVIYNVQEIYPDVAVNVGAVQNRCLIWCLSFLENLVYRKAHAITVISVRMRDRLIEKGVPAIKLSVIPNFVDTRNFAPLPKDNVFSRQHGLWDKFVVSYAGNMGRLQQLDVLVEAAALLAANPRIHFLLMGSGTEAEALRQLAAAKGLRNVIFLKHQPYVVMPEAYAAMDACYVSQAIGTSSDGIPSKIYRILSSARPVLACTDVGSDLAKLVEEARAGIVVTSADARVVANAICKAADDEKSWAQLGRNGRDHVVAQYDRSIVSGKYNCLIAQLLAGGLDDKPNCAAGPVL